MADRPQLAAMNHPPSAPDVGWRYVVGWPDLDVVKIGATHRGRARWRPFLLRGGIMLALHAFPRPYDAETALEEAVAPHMERAFDSRQEAAHILGCGGSGYLECYHLPTSEWRWLVSCANEIGGDI